MEAVRVSAERLAGSRWWVSDPAFVLRCGLRNVFGLPLGIAVAVMGGAESGQRLVRQGGLCVLSWVCFWVVSEACSPMLPSAGSWGAQGRRVVAVGSCAVWLLAEGPCSDQRTAPVSWLSLSAAAPRCMTVVVWSCLVQRALSSTVQLSLLPQTDFSLPVAIR